MQRDLPVSLARKRGVRAALLRHLPQTWHEEPQVFSLSTQPVSIPSVRQYTVSLKAELGRYSFTPLSPVGTSPNLCTWELTTHSPDLCTFIVAIHGIHYRTENEPEDTLITDEPQTFGQPLGLNLPESDRGTFQTKVVKIKKHPFEHLYGGLYPPPDEVLTDHFPRSSELKEYQKQGIQFLIDHPYALLADGMGMGKTVQCAIAISILKRTERVGRVLIICPKAVIGQWQLESQIWAGLLPVIADGQQSRRKILWKEYPGIIIATPHIVLNDIEWVRQSRFDLVVCDDITVLMNPSGKMTNVIRSIPRRRSWCLSGTPMQQKPEDLPNLMEFVCPGLFTREERKRAPSKRVLQSRVKPYFLRRRKLQYLSELPEKHRPEPVKYHLSGEQLEAYLDTESGRWNKLKDLGDQRSKFHIFATISKLMRICNYYGNSSVKLELLRDNLDEIYNTTNDKIIVFSNWVQTLKFLEINLKKFDPVIYHGGLTEKARNLSLSNFKNYKRILLMSTKAGGMGLNLQEANHIFFFDRPWNPARESQGEDRAWRLGQKKPVHIHRYIGVGTIEERIHEVLLRKSCLFDEIIETMSEIEDDYTPTDWSLDELIGLLRPSDIEKS